MKTLIKKLLREGLNDTIIVYHGTILKYIESIKKDGLLDSKLGANWYTVSTDFGSALYHASTEDGEPAYVIEFEVPIQNTKWYGYPYFWPPNERNNDSTWFAIKQTIPPSLIRKIHEIPYDKWVNQKNIGY